MLEELRQQSLQEIKYVKHPYISFIFFHKENGFCVDHPKPNGMNVGAMKQHLRGKAHGINPETGIPIKKVNFSEIIKESQNKEPIKSKRELFDDHYHMATKLCELKDRDLAIKIANRELEDPIRIDMINHLFWLKLKDEKPKLLSEDKEFIKATVKSFLQLIPR